MRSTRSKRLSITAVVVTSVIVMMLLTRWMLHCHIEEKFLIQQLQKKLGHLRDVWSKCFHSSMEYEGRLLQLVEYAEADDRQDQNRDRKNTKNCKVGFIAQNGTCVRCPEGTFSFDHWIVCVPLLSCDDVNYAVQIGRVLYTVGCWDFYEGRWNDYDIIYASSDDGTVIDFERVLKLIPHKNLLYPIGMCYQEGGKTKLLFARNNDILGSANKLNSIMAHKNDCDNEIVRFRLALDYVEILVHLHSGSREAQFVLCNSHSLSLLLSQFFITDNLKLVLGAFDNLPVLKTSAEHDEEAKIKCSQRELRGTFIAPEQAWPHQSSKVFNPFQQPGYTERADVWKIPDVTRALLGRWSGTSKIMGLLEVMHRKCKSLEPSSRPTATQVLQEYLSVWKLLLA